MKKISLFLLGMIALGSLSAQAYQKGDQILMFGIGFGGDQPSQGFYIEPTNPISGPYRAYPAPNTLTRDIKLTPITVAVNYQYAIHEYISLGAYLSPSFSSAKLTGFYNSNSPIRTDIDFDGNDESIYGAYSENRFRSSWYYGIKFEGHFSELIGLMDELDLYAGFSIGGNFQRERVSNRYLTNVVIRDGNTNYPSNDIEYESYSYSPNGHSVSPNVFLGARYYFQENLGLYLELGLVHRYAQIGVSYVIR